MKKYKLELSKAALKDLKRLPMNVQKMIIYEHLPKIRENPVGAGIPLVGALKGEQSYHFGKKPEYRIIYFIEKRTIIVTILGTREGIYKRAKRRKTD